MLFMIYNGAFSFGRYSKTVLIAITWNLIMLSSYLLLLPTKATP